MPEQCTLYCHDCEEKQWVGKRFYSYRAPEETEDIGAWVEYIKTPHQLWKVWIVSHFLFEHKGHNIEYQGESSGEWPVDTIRENKKYSRQDSAFTNKAFQEFYDVIENEG